MKKYPCPKCLDDQSGCEFGGMKYYNYGFLQGTDFYCRKNKQYVCYIDKCPLGKDVVERL